jgi:hypothetical protein
MYFNGMCSRHTKIETLFHKKYKTFIYFKQKHYIHGFISHSVIKFKYAGVIDERNALAVDRQGQLNHFLPSLDQLEAIQKKGGLFALLDISSPAEHGRRLQHCIDSSNRTTPFPVRINVT